MAVFHKEINLTTIANRPSYHDVTADVMEALAISGIQDGICVVSSPHTTCAVFLKNLCMTRIIMVTNSYKSI